MYPSYKTALVSQRHDYSDYSEPAVLHQCVTTCVELRKREVDTVKKAGRTKSEHAFIHAEHYLLINTQKEKQGSVSSVVETEG